MKPKSKPKTPLEYQEKYLDMGVQYFSSVNYFTRMLGVNRSMYDWWRRGNLMNAETSLKFEELFEWADCSKIHPGVWTEEVMIEKRKIWKKEGFL